MTKTFAYVDQEETTSLEKLVCKNTEVGFYKYIVYQKKLAKGDSEKGNLEMNAANNDIIK
jgi:hypothetical protein